MTGIIIIGPAALFSSPLPRDSVTVRDSPGVTRLRGHETVTSSQKSTQTLTWSLQPRAPGSRFANTDVIVPDRKGRELNETQAQVVIPAIFISHCVTQHPNDG